MKTYSYTTKKISQFLKKLFCHSLTLYILVGCVGADHSSQNIPYLDMEKVDTKKKIYLSELADRGELIELETVPASYIKFITDSYVTDDNIIICDNNIPKVSIYQRNGKFLKNIGSAGKGPGEFTGLIDFCFYEPEKLIYIQSSSQRKICVYNIDGKWIKDFNTDGLSKFPIIDAMEFIGDKLVVILRRPIVEVEDFYQVWFFDKDLNIIDKKKHIPPSEKAGVDMQESIEHARYNNGLIYYDFYGDTLFYIDKEMDIKPILKLKYNRMPNDLAQKEGVFEKNSDYSRIRGFGCIPPYVHFALVQSIGKVKYIDYNLTENEATLTADDPCQTFLSGKGIINDITGISAFYGGEYYPSGFMARNVSRWVISTYVEKKCIEEKSREYPEIMNRFKAVFSDKKEDGNEVIELIYLKSGH